MAFVEKYISYCQEFTDAPLRFHKLLGYFIMATLIGKRCSLDFGQHGLYPCMWVILVAPSGLFRKSTSLAIAKNILQTVDPLVILPTAFSGEALFEKLDQQPSGALIYGEFDRFAGMLSKEYMNGTTALLTEIFDCPTSIPRVTISKKSFVQNPFINIAAGSTTEWLFKRLTDNDIGSGFLPRFLMVYEHDLGAIKSIQPPHDVEKFNELVNLSQRIRVSQGTFHYSDEAYDYYDRWYHGFIKKTLAVDKRLDPFMVRVADYAHKVALLNHIDNMGDGNNEIGLGSIEESCVFIENCFAGIRTLICEEMVFTHYQKLRKAVLKLVQRRVRISKGDMLRHLKVEATRLNSALESLKEEGSIEIETIMHKQGRPGTYVKLSEKSSQTNSPQGIEADKVST